MEGSGLRKSLWQLGTMGSLESGEARWKPVGSQVSRSRREMRMASARRQSKGEGSFGSLSTNSVLGTTPEAAHSPSPLDLRNFIISRVPGHLGGLMKLG